MYIYIYIHMYMYIHICIYTYMHVFINPPHPINHSCSLTGKQISQKNILLIVHYKYLKIVFRGFYFPESDPPHKIMRYWFYYSIQLVYHFHLINMIRWKCFVPQWYQIRRGISGGPALKYFYMIHRSGRTYETCTYRYYA